MSECDLRNITPEKMSIKQNENISPQEVGIPQRTSMNAAVKRVPLKLSIPGAKYQFPESHQPNTAPVHPFIGSKLNQTPEFITGSPLSAGSRFGTLSQRMGEFDQLEDGFMLGSSLISGFDSNGSLQIGSMTASPEHSPLLAQLMEATGSSPGGISSQGSGSTSSITRLMRLSPAQLHGCYQHLDEMSDLAETGNTTIGPPTPPTRSSQNLFNTSNASSAAAVAATSANATSTMASTTAQELLSSSKSSKLSSASSSTTSRMAKTSSTQRLQHMSSLTSSSSSSSSSTSSSSTSTKASSAAAIKQGLGEMQNSMAEMKNMMGHSSASQISTSSSSTMSSSSSQSSQLKKVALANSSSNLSELQKRLRSSMDSLDEPAPEYQVTHPDSDSESMVMMKPPNGVVQNSHLMNGSVDTVKFEQKKMTSESKTKVVTDNFSSEQATVNSAQMKKLQAGDVQYQEEAALAAMSNKMEVDGVKTEEKGALLKEARSMKMGDFQQAEANNIAAHSVKVQSDHFSAEKKAITQAQQRQTVSSTGIFNQEKHVSSATQSKFTSHSTVTSSSQMSTHSTSMNGTTISLGEDFPSFDDLERLGSNPAEIENAIHKYSNHFTTYVENLQTVEQIKKAPNLLNVMNEIIRRAWAVPTHGHELGASLCDTLRTTGGLDILMKNCIDNDSDVQFSSARLLEQCLTTENRMHVVKNGLDKVVNVACVCTRNNATDHSRVGTGILEHLFKHSEDTCSNVIRLGGLDAVLFECRKNDVETLRHCAGALANLSLYGGAENQEAMINRKVPSWLFPLAFHHDENIKYYACLAIVVLVANKEIEAEVIKSGTLNLVEPFVTSHNPSEFAKSNLAHAHGQSKHWLQRLVPVLSSKREEARNLAAFHFCMEAGIKKEQGNTNIFKEIGAIEPLIRVASSPNAIASKFAAQALRLIGEEVPHKLSQQVPLWSTEDVREWVKQIGFVEYEHNFFDSKVDGDLLLQLTEDNLLVDIGMGNGIRRKRFERELQNLKKMADYSSRDPDNLHMFLYKIAPEYTIYTYSMLNAGVDLESLRSLDDDQLVAECNIRNSIHRARILNAIKSNETISSLTSEKSTEKNLDVFVSYRRSNGSQLASLLKVHLELRGFSVFIDVERLEAGKFDNNLLQSIRHAKHFLLVLTQDALERCVDDAEGKDWVHREIVAALNSDCNIIPIIDNFQWPEPERLPEDMRGVCHFNGVRWIHDYQDACVDKLERSPHELCQLPDCTYGIPLTETVAQAHRRKDRAIKNKCLNLFSKTMQKRKT
ncbi:NAD(+) hydrolase sarm1 isoform X2 [Toxorhynchites rutilus septentrionalis]|uniref:NAD(+) hydrolase sarm1 isoform X2 n=1 Tax=Toxorhynchites rutilus septentrionalis TaxID=329112 RepID=UPI002478E83C|nr:NAD(+) hydrolase sarm1 isoform X2 [Toxorhynchites rutilus septentrionalis]